MANLDPIPQNEIKEGHNWRDWFFKLREKVNAAPSGLMLPIYANNAAALAGGLAIGSLYRTGANPDPVMVVH